MHLRCLHSWPGAVSPATNCLVIQKWLFLLMHTGLDKVDFLVVFCWGPFKSCPLLSWDSWVLSAVLLVCFVHSCCAVCQAKSCACIFRTEMKNAWSELVMWMEMVELLRKRIRNTWLIFFERQILRECPLYCITRLLLGLISLLNSSNLPAASKSRIRIPEVRRVCIILWLCLPCS